MRIQANTKDAYQLFHDGILALARAERQGIKIDVDYCKQKSRHLERKIEYYQKQLEKTKLYRQWVHVYGGKTNIHSNHQLANLLYNRMKIEPEKITESGKGATDEEALKRLDVPGLDLILSIRKLAKVKTTYLDAFIREQAHGFIHPSFNLHTVRTYRSSSSNPNFQNIPKRDKEAMKICRRAIIPRPGHLLIEADFSSLEVNISECYHKDPVMMEYLLNKDSDMHLDMARQIFMLPEMNKDVPIYRMLRSAAKSGFVFPQFYGDYYGNNARSIAEWVSLPKGRWKDRMGVELPEGHCISDHFINHGIKSFDQFIEHMKQVEDDFWNRRFKVYGQWKEEWIRKYRKRGYLKMHTGFTCSGIMRRNEIVNYPIQGSAFHCLLYTFIQMDKRMRKERWESRLVGQIHDSILMDVAPAELSHIEGVLNEIVAKELPGHWGWIIVPLEIDVDRYEIDSPWVKE